MNELTIPVLHSDLIDSFGTVVPWLGDPGRSDKLYQIYLKSEVSASSLFEHPIATVEADNGDNQIQFSLPLVNYSESINLERLKQASYVCLIKLGPKPSTTVRVQLDTTRSGRRWGSIQSTIRKRIRGACVFEQWNVGIVANDSSDTVSVLKSWERPPLWMPRLPKNEFVADPFLVEHHDRLFVLYEHLGKSKVGRIQYRTFDGSFSAPKDLLVQSTHLSYPYVVRRDSSVFVIPESSARKQVCLHEFNPVDASLGKPLTLLGGTPAVDTSICHHNGQWWMFCTVAGLLENAALFVFCSANIEGPYQPHHLNPVKIDFKGARPGGTVIHNKLGQLLRPGQVCWNSYGERLVVHSVDELTQESFSESEVRQLLPDANGGYPAGLHTLSFDGGWAAVDCLRDVLDPLKMLR